ncbi:MAG: hypothetical protein V3U06_13010 [Candidatus Binatia bacterium]
MEVTVTTIILGLPDGKHVRQTPLILPAPTLTLRELIAQKENQEDAAQGKEDNKLAPTDRAFVAKDYMVVIDDQRIVDPDTVLTLHTDTRVEFIKILPLVGG